MSRRERLRRYGDLRAGRPAFVQENGRATTVNEVRDAYVQPGDFIRLREVSASFTVPDRWLNSLGRVSGMSIGLGLQNLAIWTDYEGADPELISAAGFDFQRSDFLTQPNPRRAVLRLNLTF